MAIIDSMLAKNAKEFDNVELDVILSNIITTEEKGKITLVFYAPATQRDYRKSYLINDIKGRVDFNRAMAAVGCTKNNYDKWLNRLMTQKTVLRISINAMGFIRFIKVLEPEKREYIAKSLLLDSIEGLKPEDKDFLMSLSLAILKKEFGH